QRLSGEYARVVWSMCSIGERAALYQLAIGGWANHKNWAALDHLWQRGLIERTPAVTIRHVELREFIQKHVSHDEWKAWQRGEAAALWDGLRLMFVVLILGVAGTALFMNQQNILGYMVAGASALTPVTKLMSELRGAGKGDKA